MPGARTAVAATSRNRPSPNHTERRGTNRPDMIVLHYTGMTNAAAAIERLCDPAAEVSAHYVVDMTGEASCLVPETRRAWHAGQAAWGGVTDVNSHSIGIEIVNPGHELGYPPFGEMQMQSVEALIAGAMDRWAIPPERVVGHACVSPGRKIDPGEKLDWRRLARKGLAVWLDPEPGSTDTADAAAFREAVRGIGYPVPEADTWSPEMLAVWRSFAMRFLPAMAHGRPFSAGVAHATRIADRWPVDRTKANQSDLP